MLVGLFYMLLFSSLIGMVKGPKAGLLFHDIAVYSFLGPCCSDRLYCGKTVQTVINLKIHM